MTKKKKNKKPRQQQVSGKQKKKKSSASPNKNELKLDVPSSLKILCILSFLGFIYCLVRDTGDYFLYSNFEEIKQGDDQLAFEQLETKLVEFEKNDLFVDDGGEQRDQFLDQLALAGIYRTILDILAMVGTALMYFRIKKGFYVYGVFQLLYVVVPFAMFGIGAMVVYDKLVLIPPLIYLVLFTTQYKYLNR